MYPGRRGGLGRAAGNNAVSAMSASLAARVGVSVQPTGGEAFPVCCLRVTSGGAFVAFHLVSGTLFGSEFAACCPSSAGSCLYQ